MPQKHYEVVYLLPLQAGPNVWKHTTKVKAIRHARIVSREFPAVRVQVVLSTRKFSARWSAMVDNTRPLFDFQNGKQIADYDNVEPAICSKRFNRES